MLHFPIVRTLLQVTERGFYRQALFLPPILTALAWLVIWLASSEQIFSTHGGGVVGLAVIVGYAGLYAGIPYLIVAAFIWVRLGTDKIQSISYSSILAITPIAVIALGIILMLIMGGVKRDFALSGFAVFYSLWGILVGYAYVLAIFALRLVAKKAGWVTADS